VAGKAAVETGVVFLEDGDGPRQILRKTFRKAAAHGDLPAGKNPVGADLGKRRKNKRTSGDAGMGQSQIGEGELKVVVIQDVQVDAAGGVEPMPGRTAETLLEELQLGEKVQGRDRAGDLDGGIPEQRGARGALEGLALIDAGAEEGPPILVEFAKVVSGGAEIRQAVPEVRPERDAHSHFRPRTSCMS
jgi:hypothetical protein